MASQQSSRGATYSAGTSPTYAYHQYQNRYADQQAQQQWMKVIPIEDDDLTFGGKPLSDWYEEDRRRYSSSSFDSTDELQRGRTRQRAYLPEAPTSHGHHKQHGHAHGHKHHKKAEKKK